MIYTFLMIFRELEVTSFFIFFPKSIILSISLIKKPLKTLATAYFFGLLLCQKSYQSSP